MIVFEHGLGCGLKLSPMQRFLDGAPAFTRSEFADDFSCGANYYFMAYP